MSAARICRDCSNLVTTDAKCPLCGAETAPHDDREDTEAYCVECAKGPFPADQIHVVTWHEDPYTQIEDGDLITRCLKCQKEIDDEAED